MQSPISSVFTTAEFDTVDEKLQAFRDNLSIVCDIAPERAFLPHFHATLTSTMLGGVLMTELCTTRQSYSRDSVEIGRSGIDHLQLVMIKQGNKFSVIGDETTIVKTGDMVLFDLGQASTSTTNICELEMGNFETLNFIVAREYLEEFLPYPHLYHGVVLRQEEPMVAILKELLLSVAQQAKLLDQAQADKLAKPIIELLAATLARNPAVTEYAQGAIASATAIKVRRIIDAKLLDPELTPDGIAAEVGISRSSLFEVCQPYGGVMTMVRKRRLNKAYRMLNQTPHANIALTAYATGFKSIDTFARAFKKEFGMTPKEANVQQVTKTLGEHKLQFADWMRHGVG